MTLTMTARRRHNTPRVRALAVDKFDRADGALGSNWTAGSEGAPQIVNGRVQGTPTTLNSAYTRIGFDIDQFSEIEVSSTPLPATAWIGPAVRMQNSGNDLYGVIYYNDPSTGVTVWHLVLYKRVSGAYTDISTLSAPSSGGLGPSGYTFNGSLNAGDKIRLSVAGTELTVWVNDKRVMRVNDSSITTAGSPGIISFNGATCESWAGGNTVAEPPAPVQVFTGAPPNAATNGGVGAGLHFKVLAPNAPNRSIPHNFLIALPVDSDGVLGYGDPMDVLYGLRIHNKYNLTVVVPAYVTAGTWGNDNPSNSTQNNETFTINTLVPWIKANFSITGLEKVLLIGFSRSGFGGATLMFRHPTVFDKGAFWDWPFDMTWAQTSGYGASTYGTQANFENNYQMTSGPGGYVDTHKAPFQSTKRLWIGGHEAFPVDDPDTHTVYNTYGILHDADPDQLRAHAWTSGWVERGLAAIVPDVIPPSPPQTLVASTPSPFEVDLSWQPSVDDRGVTGYNIERVGPGGGAFVQVGTTTGTSYVDSSVIGSSSYNYRVKAIDNAGNLSTYSNIVSVTTATPDTTPPTQPGTLSAPSVSSGSVSLSWGASTDNVAVDHYTVERNNVQIATTTGTTFTDNSVIGGDTYSYRVRAVDTDHNLSPYSNTISVTTPASSVRQLVLTQVASDNFNRSNGSIAGANNWLAFTSGSAVIASNALASSAAAPTSLGDYRTSEAYNTDQYSKAVVSSAPASGDWVGLTVRNQNNQNNYLGIWFNNSGQLVLAIYKTVSGSFVALAGTQGLGASFPVGTVLTMRAEGSVITFEDSLGNGCSAIDTTFTGGTPGVLIVGTSGALDTWEGGKASTTALSTSAVADNFNRANNGLTVGQSNWQVMSGYPAVDPPIVSNQINPTTGAHAAAVRTDTFSLDHWSAVQQGTAAMNTAGFSGVLTRVNAALNSGYLGIVRGGSNISYQLFRLDNGSSTLLAIRAGPAITNDPAGTEYTLVSQGNRHSLRTNGAEILAVTDTTYPTGKPGVMGFPISSMDNWSAGNL